MKINELLLKQSIEKLEEEISGLEGNPNKTGQLWKVTITDGIATPRGFYRKGTYEQVKAHVADLPPSYIVKIEPVEDNKTSKTTAPELLKAEMPLVRHIEKELAEHGYEKGTEEYDEVFKHTLAFYRKFGNIDAINKQDMEEGVMTNMLAKVYDVGANIGGKVKSALGMNYQMQPSGNRTGEDAANDKAELDKETFDLWKQYQAQIERGGQGNLISNNKDWYKKTLDKWLTSFFKMHTPFHSAMALTSTTDSAVLNYISNARSEYKTMLAQKPWGFKFNAGLHAYTKYPVMPKVGQTIQFGGQFYVFKGKQWVEKKTNRIAERNIAAKLNKIAVQDLQSTAKDTASAPENYARAGSQETSQTEEPAYKRRKKIVKNVTR